MIDWLNVVGNGLWIIGCALGISTVSYAYWNAAYSQQALRVTFQHHPIQYAINLAGSLFCLGLAITSETTFQLILWALVFVWANLLEVGFFVWAESS